jgi:putative DNA primase/helicase
MKPIEKLLDKLDGVVKTSNGWDACCPAHDDKSPSLSISENGKEGRILMNCHAGCRPKEIMKSIDMKMSDLMPQRSNDGPADDLPAKETPDSPLPTEEETRHYKALWAAGSLLKKFGLNPTCWGYYNAEGDLVGVILRWDESGGTKVIKPVAKIGDSWEIGAMPEPRPLYRLPQIKNEDRVYVTEGEKAADALVSLGLPATTSSGGANAAKQTDWSPLAGKDVVIFPDNDESGRRYAKKVASLCLKLNPPARVRIVELPNLPEKGDAFDYVEARREQQ